MTNLEAVVAALASHREARAWDDTAVARDILGQLGMDEGGNAAKARPLVDPGISEDEVLQAEAVAKQAAEKAKAARDALDAQKADGSADAKVGEHNPPNRADAERAAHSDDPTQPKQQETRPVPPAAATPPTTPAAPAGGMLTSDKLQNPHQG